MMRGSIRLESRPHLPRDDSYTCRLLVFQTLQTPLLLRWYFLVSIFFSIGICPGTSFSAESPSCVGRLSTSGIKVSGSQKRDNSTTTFNYHVIGTSHFRCDSNKEVSALIRRQQPDGVVIELDPERLLRLTLDDAITRTNAMANTSVDVEDVIEDRWFGGDFLSAIETSKDLDIPIFLGDEYPIETRERFKNTLFDADSYRADTLLMAVASLFRPRLRRTNDNRSEMLSVNIFGTFLEDPRKLLPLAATLSLPVSVVLLTILLDATGANAKSPYEAIATLLSLVASFVASCKVYNNLIVDRDSVLASNVQRAATTMALLKSNQLIRKRWTFSVNESDDEDITEEIISDQAVGKHLSPSIPLFTLKNPLEQNAVRNLNLFEPRWLKMIDRLLSKTQQLDSEVTKANRDTPASDSSNKDQRIIGCVTCTNKFYSAINVNKASKNGDPPSFQEGRYADVIFRGRGRFGELTNVVEGSRPSGARKVGATILGKKAFDLSSSKDENGNDRISVVEEGYLTASGLRPINEDEEVNDMSVENAPDEINIVVVVGLLHANGVLDCLLRTNSS